MAKVKFKPRVTKPTKADKWYVRNGDGGWSGAIKGSPTDECTILANCAGYSQARFCEANGRPSCDLLEPCNPCDYDKYLYGKCTTGDKPKLGAVIIWKSADGKGKGHVGNVEGIVDENTIVTSESHYGGSAFDLNIHMTEKGERYYKSGYKFYKFIYPPYIEDIKDAEQEYNELLADYEALRYEAKNRENELLAVIEARNAEAKSLDEKIGEFEADCKKAYDELGDNTVKFNSIIDGLNDEVKAKDDKIKALEKAVAENDKEAIIAEYAKEIECWQEQTTYLSERIAELKLALDEEKKKNPFNWLLGLFKK